MSTNARPRVLLFGAGGVGAVYLYILQKVADTAAVCRSNYEVVSKEGFILNSAIFGQGLKFKPPVVKTCEEAASIAEGNAYDYIVICSKAIPGLVPKLIAPVVTPRRTSIVLVQNGMGIEQEYADAFPETPIISAVVYLPATQRPSGVVKHGEIELLQIGQYPASAPNSPAKAFVELIQAAGGTAKIYDDVQLKRWTKLLINTSWNPMCALARTKDTDVLDSCNEASGVVRAVMMETRDIAAAYGYPITDEQIEQQLERAEARVPIDAGIEPSMLQDALAGRRLEIEAIVGNVVRMGKAKGVKCDRLEMLYVLAKTLDLHIGKSR